MPVISFLCRNPLNPLNQFVIETLEVKTDAVSFEKCLELCRSEFVTIICDDLSRVSIIPDDLFEDFNSGGSGTFLEWSGNGSGHSILNCHNDVSVSARSRALMKSISQSSNAFLRLYGWIVAIVVSPGTA